MFEFSNRLHHSTRCTTQFFVYSRLFSCLHTHLHDYCVRFYTFITFAFGSQHQCIHHFRSPFLSLVWDWQPTIGFLYMLPRPEKRDNSRTAKRLLDEPLTEEEFLMKRGRWAFTNNGKLRWEWRVINGRPMFCPIVCEEVEKKWCFGVKHLPHASMEVSDEKKKSSVFFE